MDTNDSPNNQTSTPVKKTLAEIMKPFPFLITGDTPVEEGETVPKIKTFAGAARVPPSSKLEFIEDVQVGMPFLRKGEVADGFRRLRSHVTENAGFDFLAVLGDMLRGRNFVSKKAGVARRSMHMTGAAFDVNQSEKRMVVVHEPVADKSYFRLWLLCSKQDGTMGKNLVLQDVRGAKVKGWFYDFTFNAERNGFKRIPAWAGWSVRGANYIRMEFWHYQNTQGLSWDEAMGYLYGSTPKDSIDEARITPAYTRTIGLNDRGLAVTNIQEKLAKIIDDTTNQPFLDRNEIDGVFGAKTAAAVKRFQLRYKLDADGLVGTKTRSMMDSVLRTQNSPPAPNK